jgi:hypothetical protein
LYIFDQRVTESDLEELAKQFQSSSVVISDILMIVFTFTSAWYYEVAAGDGTPKKPPKWKGTNPKKEGDKLPTDWYASQKKTGEEPGKSDSHQKGMTNPMSPSSSSNILYYNIIAVKNTV